MQIDPDSLGGFLRQEREQQGVTLQDISAVTKIQLRFLEALEHNEYDQLPPTPFVLGFLRAYAQALDLDAQAILTAYHASVDIPQPPEAPPSLLTGLPHRSGSRRLTSLVGLILLIGAVLWLLRTESSQQSSSQRINVVGRDTPSALLPPDVVPGSPPPVTVEPTSLSTSISRQSSEVNAQEALSTPPPEKPLVKPETEPPSVTEEPSPVTAAVSETPSVVVDEPSSQNPEVSRLPTPKRLILQAKALQETWLRVKIDGATRDDILLSSGKSARWEANEQFLLTVGNVQGTRVTLNGQEIPLPTARSNVIRDFLLTRQLLN